MKRLLIEMIDLPLWCIQGIIALITAIVGIVYRGVSRGYVWMFRLRRRMAGVPLVQPHDAEYGFGPEEDVPYITEEPLDVIDVAKQIDEVCRSVKVATRSGGRLDGGPVPSELFEAAVLDYAAWHGKHKGGIIVPGDTEPEDQRRRLYQAAVAFASPILDTAVEDIG